MYMNMSMNAGTILLNPILGQQKLITHPSKTNNKIK